VVQFKKTKNQNTASASHSAAKGQMAMGAKKACFKFEGMVACATDGAENDLF
jgi:hypothetical protein